MRFADVIPGCVYEQDGYDWVKVDEETAWCPSLDRSVLGNGAYDGPGTMTQVDPDEEVRQPTLEAVGPSMDFYVLFRKGLKLVGPFFSQEAAEHYAGLWGAGTAFVVQPSIGK